MTEDSSNQEPLTAVFSRRPILWNQKQFCNLQNKHLAITEKNPKKQTELHIIQVSGPIFQVHLSSRIFIFPDCVLSTFGHILRLNFSSYQNIPWTGKWSYRKVRLHFSTNPTDNIYKNSTRLVSYRIFHNLQMHLNKIREAHLCLSSQ